MPASADVDDDTLGVLARDRGGPQADPFPVVVDADVPDDVAAGEPLRLAVTADHEGTADLDVRASEVSVVLTHDGQVLATPFEWDSPTDGWMRMAAGATVPLGATSEMRDCTTRGLGTVPEGEEALPLPTGTYDVWVVLDLYLAPPADKDGDLELRRVVGGPWPLTVR